MLVDNVTDPRVFHSRKTMQIIQKMIWRRCSLLHILLLLWQYGRISEKQMVDDLVLMGYDRQVITDVLEKEECP